jgi:hypothetical protein
MTGRATVGQPGPNRPISIEVSDAITFIRPLSLRSRKFALKQLPPTPDRAKWIALNDEKR